MDEVYWGCFRCHRGLPEAVAEERVCPPSQVALPETVKSWIGVGAGWHYQDRMPGGVRERMVSVDTGMTVRAAWVARLAQGAAEAGRTVPAAQAQPVYLRDEVAWKKLPGRG